MAHGTLSHGKLMALLLHWSTKQRMCMEREVGVQWDRVLAFPASLVLCRSACCEADVATGRACRCVSHDADLVLWGLAQLNTQ